MVQICLLSSSSPLNRLACGGSFNEKPNNNCALAYCAESATHHNYRSIDRWIDGAGCELYVNGGHQVTRGG